MLPFAPSSSSSPRGRLSLALSILLALAACSTSPGDESAATTAGVTTATDADASSPTVDPLVVDPLAGSRARAAAAAKVVVDYYAPSTGRFRTTGWWNAANVLSTLVDHAELAGAPTPYATILSTAYDRGNGGEFPGFLNEFYDDEGWWALTWIDAFDLTRNGAYLDRAKSIFDDMTRGWDSTCGGGVYWRRSESYKNAISNELFFAAAVRLHQRSGPSGGLPTAPSTYLAWADKEWAWFRASGLIGGDGLVRDGLSPACAAQGATWSYNQGVVVGGLVDYATAKNDGAYLAQAHAIADAAKGRLVDAEGALMDGCGNPCGADVPHFKGAFMRNLAYLARATGSATDIDFITTNASLLWNKDRDATNHFGFHWSGPVDQVDAMREAAALDALVAAIPYGDPPPDLARGKTAVASGACGPGQDAAAATDGTMRTKWCGPAGYGPLFLSVDLGAPTAMARVVLRHAGAGGEDPGFNTRDFVVRISDDGATWRDVANVLGNTQPVTIHAFSPTTARYVRVDITTAQTSRDYFAARIGAVEVYAR